MFEKYIGRRFKLGESDCYSLLRDFYRNEYQIELPDYARPENYWEHGFNLFSELYSKHGFEQISDSPLEWQVGDVFLVCLNSEHPSHAAIYAGDSKILHHPPHRFSNLELYKGIWRNCTVARIRHKSQKERKSDVREMDIVNHPYLRRFREGLDNVSDRDIRTTKLSG